MSRLFTRVVVSLLLMLFWAAAAAALDYRDYIGFTQLKTELGSSKTPTGAGVVVTQVEADDTTNPDYYSYLPNSSDPQFSGKTFTVYPSYKKPGINTLGISLHATIVGQYFYGKTSSIAPGITSINNYEADDWLLAGFLKTGSGAPPLTTSARVANHSWVGAFTQADGDIDALQRLDWVINRDEYIQVVAMNNGSGVATQSLLGSSFNAIAVGRSDGASKHGSVALDSLYTAGRTRPDLVAPLGATSYATPLVSSAAALLVEVGHAGATTLSTDPAVKYTYSRSDNVNKIYNAERSEVVKAALMAGASRTASQLLLGYHPTTGINSNGLDSTYGAGQLNIYNSYHIIAAGEQNSLQDAPGTRGYIGSYGFDYDPYFGGLPMPSPGQPASNRTASYYFKALNAGQMTASLVWNLDADNLTLYHLGLYLYDLTDLVHPLTHADGTLDNTENLWWTSLSANHNYLLQVKAVTADFLWDYSLAWDITAAVAQVPIPATVYLLGTGFLVLVGFRRKFRS